MNNLRDQLLKAGLVNEKKVRKAQHENRIKRKKQGFKKLEQDKKDKENEWQKQQETKKQEQQNLASEQKEVSSQQESIARIKDIIIQSRIHLGRPGKRLFYFVTRQQKIKMFALPDNVAFKLEKGEHAIAEIPGSRNDKYAIIPRSKALLIKELGPEFVLFLN